METKLLGEQLGEKSRLGFLFVLALPLHVGVALPILALRVDQHQTQL